jgi:HD-GYP domain-containing protein (c-di-GMP phosphodiesterase class II)
MTRLSGSHFEPRVVEAFLRMIESLYAEHGDGLDAFLASAASSSALVQSRESLRALLDRVAPRDVTSFYPGRTAA